MEGAHQPRAGADGRLGSRAACADRAFLDDRRLRADARCL